MIEAILPAQYFNFANRMVLALALVGCTESME